METKICPVAGCTKNVRTANLCGMHYMRVRRHDTLDLPYRDPLPRFWSQVNKTDTCWLWTGSDNGIGYGHIHIDGKLVSAHRFSYETFKGPIPNGHVIDHLCGNPPCVNPDHLEPVTQAENMKRAMAKRPKRTHCHLGHPFDEVNTYVSKDGRRMCRACNTLKSKQLRDRYKAQHS